eukprot:TRINITY_DN14722_c0_g1_i2.p1 TRINITY_DN14722_c0_g1~~TRINITY_DN14722_c0_g1_i2.p1  ORF type:complete len:101 (+),score=25.54 TRINITY_DN14722_c0_g1_i2:120-422(+)
MKLKILQGSATSAILSAIRNRFDIHDDEGLMLVDKDGVDQVIDHNLDTGNYRLETTKKPIEVKKLTKGKEEKPTKSETKSEIGRAVQQECRDRSRMPSSA